MSSDDAATSLAEAWIHHNRVDLQRRYGEKFLAVYECAVIDWGDDADALRERVQSSFGDRVFVGPVPTDPPPAPGESDLPDFRRLASLKELRPNRRRLLLNAERHFEIQDLIGSRGCELLGGIVYIDSHERRYAEHDYRLLVEHELVPKDTMLVGGIIFWQEPPTDVADTAWLEGAARRHEDR